MILMVWRRLSKISRLSASINRASGMAMGGVSGRQPLDVAHHVVAQVPHQPAPEPGQPRGRHRLKPASRPAQVLKGVDRRGPGSLEPALPPDDGSAVLHLKHQGRIEPQKTEAAPLLAALDALQQKGTALAPQLLVGRHRGLQVPQDLPVDRDQIALPGHVAESGKIRINHAPLR